MTSIHMLCSIYKLQLYIIYIFSSSSSLHLSLVSFNTTTGTPSPLSIHIVHQSIYPSIYDIHLLLLKSLKPLVHALKGALHGVIALHQLLVN